MLIIELDDAASEVLDEQDSLHTSGSADLSFGPVILLQQADALIIHPVLLLKQQHGHSAGCHLRPDFGLAGRSIRGDTT